MKLVDGVRLADEIEARAATLLQVLHLALQLRGFQRALADQQQTVSLEGLFYEVIGAAADRADGGFNVAVTGDHDDRQVWMHVLDLIQERQAVEPGALKPDVEQQQTGHTFGDCGKR